MAKIVAVHGVGQQYKGEDIIRREWFPALNSGLHLMGGDLNSDSDVAFPFYGHLFRPRGTLATGDNVDPASLTEEERELLKQWWKAAAMAAPDWVVSPDEYGEAETLVRVPQFAQRALNAIAESPFWAGMGQHLMLGDLKQVTAYMNDSDVHRRVLNTVLDKITDETRVVIGHSLGSIVAYEALCEKPESVASFLSLGSPLGIRNVVFDKLTPKPYGLGHLGHWPGNVKHWTNIADRADIIALEKKLAPFFGNDVKDVLVDNGSNAHYGESYLTSQEAGAAILEGL